MLRTHFVKTVKGKLRSDLEARKQIDLCSRLGAKVDELFSRWADPEWSEEDHEWSGAEKPEQKPEEKPEEKPEGRAPGARRTRLSCYSWLFLGSRNSFPCFSTKKPAEKPAEKPEEAKDGPTEKDVMQLRKIVSTWSLVSKWRNLRLSEIHEVAVSFIKAMGEPHQQNELRQQFHDKLLVIRNSDSIFDDLLNNRERQMGFGCGYEDEVASEENDTRLRQFAQLSSDGLELGLSLQQLRNTSPLDRAYLMGTLTRLASSPDIPLQLQTNSGMTNVELASANFVVKRFISSMVKNTMDSTLLALTALQYKFAQPQKSSDNEHELMQRFLSVLLGYEYPYLTSEQPASKSYLSLDVVIPFLFRHRKKLVGILFRECAGSGLPDDDGRRGEGDSGDATPPDDGSTMELFSIASDDDNTMFAGTSLEMGIENSCLLQAVVARSKKPQDESGPPVEDDVLALINSWHRLWSRGHKQNSASDKKKLVNDLVDFLTSDRYSLSPDEREVRTLQTQLEGWRQFEIMVASFRKYNKEHGEELVGNGVLPEGHERWIPKTEKPSDDPVCPRFDLKHRPQTRRNPKVLSGVV